MGKKIIGTTLTLPAPFDTKSSNPIDTRTVVENLSDLYNPDTFGTSGNYCFVHEGINVYVSSEKATYMYVGPVDEGNGVLSTEVAKEENWIKITNNSEIGDIQDVIKSLPHPLLGSPISIEGNGLIKAPVYTKTDGKYTSGAMSSIGLIPIASTDKYGLMDPNYIRANLSQQIVGSTNNSGEQAKLKYIGSGLWIIDNIYVPSISTLHGNAKHITFLNFPLSVSVYGEDYTDLNSNPGFITLKSANKLNSLPNGIKIKLEDNEIKLTDKDNNLVSSIPASDFIKDGMLDSVDLIGNDLVFEFNTESGKQAIRVDLTKFIDVYTAGNGIDINNKEISVDLSLILSFTNLKDKVDTIEEGALVNTVTSVAGKTGAVTLNKNDVGLDNVDNTTDLNKPISLATLAALDNKADIDDLSNVLAEEVLDESNFPKISTYTREELKKDLFIDLWNLAFKVENSNGSYTVYGKYDPVNAPDNQHPFLGNTLWLTYEEALAVYEAGAPGVASGNKYAQRSIRTNLPPKVVTGNKYTPLAGAEAGYMFHKCLNLEIANLASYNIALTSNITPVFALCTVLRKILGVISLRINTKGEYFILLCPQLEEFKLSLLSTNLNLQDSPKLNLATFLFMVQNRDQGSINSVGNVTVTVHPEVYAKLTGDTTNEVAAALTPEELAQWQLVLTDGLQKGIQFTTI